MIYPNFVPMVISRAENETSTNIVLSSFRPWTKIAGRHEQVSYSPNINTTNFIKKDREKTVDENLKKKSLHYMLLFVYL